MVSYMRVLRIALPAFLAAAQAHLEAQSAPARLEFEVTSIKPGSDMTAPGVTVGVRLDGAQIHITDLSLHDYISLAYRLKNYQVTGPDWIGTRFDIHAKLPDGATRQQVPEMMQALLADRFELKFHRETKEFPVYLLTTVPGIKLKESPPDPDDAASAPGGDVTDVAATGGRGGVNISFGKGSGFSFANNKVEATKLTMPQFADTLARYLDRPVVDRTELTGKYDFSLELTQDDYMAMLIRSALSAGVTLPQEALRLLEGASEDSLHSGLHRVGLKLDRGKAPLEVLVVDHMLKAPTAN